MISAPGTLTRLGARELDIEQCQVNAEAILERVVEREGDIVSTYGKGMKNPFRKIEHDCETELKRQPGYSISQGRPASFNCSCGKRYRHVESEAEGAWWELVGDER